MKITEKNTPSIAEQLKEAIQKKVYEKPEKVSEEGCVASKSKCGRCGGCGELVRQNSW